MSYVYSYMTIRAQLIDNTKTWTPFRINFGPPLTGRLPKGAGGEAGSGEHLGKRPRGAKGCTSPGDPCFYGMNLIPLCSFSIFERYRVITLSLRKFEC